MPHSPLSRYEQLIEHCQVSRDAGQEAVLERLQALYQAYIYERDKPSMLSRLLGLTPSSRARGIYMWGGVGRGKSMLMDLFFASLPNKRKERVHFHGFMQNVHSAIHTHRKAGKDDPLALVADGLIAEYDVICFDELQVHDIADASILARLFEALFAAGLVIIFTSNRPPEDLYQHGLQRERFEPLIALVRSHMEVIEIQSAKDYRQNRAAALQTRYLMPANAQTRAELLRLCECSTYGSLLPAELSVQGRRVPIPRASGDVAWFSFTDLCEQPYGAADYLAIVESYKMLFVADIPTLTPEHRNEAKRFVTLIDVLYEAGTVLCCTADATPDALYMQGDGSFEFARTASRLHEMMSDGYGR